VPPAESTFRSWKLGTSALVRNGIVAATIDAPAATSSAGASPGGTLQDPSYRSPARSSQVGCRRAATL
jgi:hypothetical protein